jgi:hypothetical protein
MMTRQDIHTPAYGAGDPVAAPIRNATYFRGQAIQAGGTPTLNMQGMCGDGVHAVDENGMPMACDPSDPSTWTDKLYVM